MICKACSADLAPRNTFCANCGARVEDPFVGTVIDRRYRIEAKIADGGFGAILPVATNCFSSYRRRTSLLLSWRISQR